MTALRFHVTAMGTHVLSEPGVRPWELGSVIRNRKGRWKATHKAHQVTTYHPTRDMAKAWLVTLETTGLDTSTPPSTQPPFTLFSGQGDGLDEVPAGTPEDAAAGGAMESDPVDAVPLDPPSIDPTTGATFVPLEGGGVQVIPVPQPLVVWRTALDNIDTAHRLVARILDTGLGAQAAVATVHAGFATEDGVLERTEHQIEITTCADQVPFLEALLVAHTSDSNPAYVVLPVLAAPTSYAAWLRRHSAGFAPDAAPQE
jgi:uncharacterized protein involved in tolerance to divalent cations